MSQSPAERTIEEDSTTEAPLTMAASVILTNLPRDASKALETAGTLAVTKSASALSRFALPYAPIQQQQRN
jgi:ubiquitin-like protein ATG12